MGRIELFLTIQEASEKLRYLLSNPSLILTLLFHQAIDGEQLLELKENPTFFQCFYPVDQPELEAVEGVLKNWGDIQNYLDQLPDSLSKEIYETMKDFLKRNPAYLCCEFLLQLGRHCTEIQDKKSWMKVRRNLEQACLSFNILGDWANGKKKDNVAQMALQLFHPDDREMMSFAFTEQIQRFFPHKLYLFQAMLVVLNKNCWSNF